MLVVCGFGLIGLLLRLCSCRLRCLFLGLLIRLALSSSAANCTDSRADSRTSACVTGDRAEGRSSGCSSHPATLRLRRIRLSEEVLFVFRFHYFVALVAFQFVENRSAEFDRPDFADWAYYGFKSHFLSSFAAVPNWPSW